MLDPVRQSCPITGHGPIAGQSGHEPTTERHVYPVFKYNYNHTTTTTVVIQYTRSERAKKDSWSSVSSLAIEMLSVTAKTSSKTHTGTHTDSGVDQRIITSRLHCCSHFSLVRTFSGKEKILYYRELLVSEKFFKKTLNSTCFTLSSHFGQTFFLLSRITC